MRSEDYKKELITILFAQKNIIILTTLLIFSGAVFVAFFWPPTYAAYGSILVKVKKPERSPEALEQAEIRYMPITKEDLASEVEMLTSHDVIERTIAHLKEKKVSPSKRESLIPFEEAEKYLQRIKEKILSPEDGGRKQAAAREIYDIKQGIKTSIAPVSNVIEVTFFHKDPDYAVVFLNALLEQYVAFRMKIYFPEEAEKFFTSQAGGLDEGLEKKRKDWMDIIEKNRIADPLKEIENNLLLKKELEQQLSAQNSLAIEKKLVIEYLEKALAVRDVQFFSFIDQPSITNLSSTMHELFIEYGNILRKYKATSDRAKPVEKQFNDALAVLRSEVTAYKDSLAKEMEITNKKIDQLKNSIKTIENRNIILQKQNILTQKIGMEMNLLKMSFETYSKRKEEAINSTLSPTTSYLSILSKAFLSDGPVFPKKRIVVPLGLAVGLITGCSFGFLREYLDHTFKKIGDIERHTGLHVIFSIPLLEEKKKKASKVSAVFAAVVLMLVAGAIWLSFMEDPAAELNYLKDEAGKNINTVILSVSDVFSRFKQDEEPFVVDVEKSKVTLRKTYEDNNDAGAKAVAFGRL